MSSLKYCLDTHPLIWYFTGQKTLSKKGREIIDGIFSEKYYCYIPSIVLLESFHVSLKVRNFIFSRFLRELRLTNIIVVPLDKLILTTCYQLPKDLDIHDRIISATSIVNKCILITKDTRLKKLSELKTIW